MTLIHRMYKYLMYGLICLCGCLYGVVYVSALDTEGYLTTKPYEGIFEGGGGAEENIDIPTKLRDQVQDEEGILEIILEALGFKFDGEQRVVQFINNLLNFFLVVIGLIALAVMIFGFYKMFVSDGEESLGEARTLVINTMIALVVIGLAWFITSWAFDLFYTASEGI